MTLLNARQRRIRSAALFAVLLSWLGFVASVGYAVALSLAVWYAKGTP